MVSVQERFLIKSGFWWRAYGMQVDNKISKALFFCPYKNTKNTHTNGFKPGLSKMTTENIYRIIEVMEQYFKTFD